MLYIKKSKASQQISDKIAEIKNTPGWRTAEDTETVRGFFDMLDKGMLRSAILPEQHGLCAYCMRRIYDDGSVMTVEHFAPLSIDKENALRYSNFLGVCDGGQHRVEQHQAARNSLCCDRAKADETEIMLDPQNAALMSGIAYRNDGKEIYFQHSDSAMEKSGNDELRDILKLNGIFGSEGKFLHDTATNILQGRNEAYNRYNLFVKQSAKKGTLTSAAVQAEIERILKMENYPEYAGVQLFYLFRKLRTLRNCGK